jgi:hypothetical protein
MDWTLHGELPGTLLPDKLQGVTLMMEATRSSETLVNFYQTTWRYNPEDSNLRTHRRENLKSYLELAFILLMLNFINIS